MKCKSCGAKLNITMSHCPDCGMEVPMGRLTGLLGIVCRHCDAYNEPDALECVACHKPFGSAPDPKPAAQPAKQKGTLWGPIPLTAAVSDPGVSAVPIAQALSQLGAAAKASALEAESAPVPFPPRRMCPACGEEVGTNSVCSRCGRSIGARGTRLLSPVAVPVADPPQLQVIPDQVSLILEHGEGFEGAVFRLGADEVQAGRSYGAVIFPNDPCLAPHHATFFYRNSVLHVRDEGSLNGVLVLLRKGPIPLRPGDVFSIGARLLRFVGLVPPAPASPPDGTVLLGAPRPQGPAILVEEWLEGGTGGRVFLRMGPSVSIGRVGCSVNLGDDPFLSHAHAEIIFEADGAARLRDLGSSNGTYVRVPPGGEHPLYDGDMVRMGREVFRVAVG